MERTRSTGELAVYTSKRFVLLSIPSFYLSSFLLIILSISSHSQPPLDPHFAQKSPLLKSRTEHLFRSVALAELAAARTPQGCTSAASLGRASMERASARLWVTEIIIILSAVHARHRQTRPFSDA